MKEAGTFGMSVSEGECVHSFGRKNRRIGTTLTNWEDDTACFFFSTHSTAPLSSCRPASGGTSNDNWIARDRNKMNCVYYAIT